MTNWTEDQALVSHRPRAAHLLAVRVPTLSVVTTANFFPAPMSMQQWDFEGSTPALFRALKPAFRFLRAVLVPAAHMTFNDNDDHDDKFKNWQSVSITAMSLTTIQMTTTTTLT